MIVTKPARGSVEETVTRLEEEIARRGLKLVTVIDHSGEADRAGLELSRHESGRLRQPGGWHAVMEAAPLAALDLPLKVLVWDDDGETKLAHLAPAELARRYGLSDELGTRLGGIEVIADAAAG